MAYYVERLGFGSQSKDALSHLQVCGQTIHKLFKSTPLVSLLQQEAEPVDARRTLGVT